MNVDGEEFEFVSIICCFIINFDFRFLFLFFCFVVEELNQITETIERDLRLEKTRDAENK